MLEQSPVRVILDARLRVPLSTSVIATAREVPTWVVGGMQASPVAEDILKAKGVEVLRLIAFAMPGLAASIVLTQALRGAGDTRVPVLFTWVGFLGVRIPLAYWLSLPSFELGPLGTLPGLNLGLFGAWLAMFADLVVRGVFFLFRFLSGSWQRIRV